MTAQSARFVAADIGWQRQQFTVRKSLATNIPSFGRPRGQACQRLSGAQPSTFQIRIHRKYANTPN